MRLKGVVFDLDGLLVDSERVQERAFNAVLARHGVRLTEADFTPLVGVSSRQNLLDLKALFPQIDEPVDELLARKDAAYADLVRTGMDAMPGAVRLVRDLRARGVAIAVASSSPRPDVEGPLRAVGLLEDFPIIASAERVAACKPAPDLYLLALRELGLPADACVALEDAGPGVASAVAAGLRCVAVPNRHTRGHDFSTAAAVAASLEEVTPASLDALLGGPSGDPCHP